MKTVELCSRPNAAPWFAATLLLLADVAAAQNPAIAGKWLLALDGGRATDYGILEVEETNGDWRFFIDGGPVNVLRLDGDELAFDLDWTDGGDRLHVTVLTGKISNGRMSGSMAEGDESTGTWSAEPWAEDPHAASDGTPFDPVGLWRSISRGTHKDAFDLTTAGAELNEAYDPTIDDPHLRCVSGGAVRMEDGPFNYEILDRGDYLQISYHYFNESRRIWMDGRDFPEGVEDSWLTNGYSIGHWEGGTLVVETRGMKPTLWDAAGMPISAAATLIERKYLDDEGQMHTDYVLEDPDHYHRPIYRHAYRARLPGSGVDDYACDPHTFYRSLDLEGRLEEYWRSTGRH